MLEVIHYENQDIPAWRCPRCRCKFTVKDHRDFCMDKHRLKDLHIKLTPQQQTFARQTRKKWL